MSPCRLIICEKSSHWSLALRIALANKPPAIVETRALAQAEAALAASPVSLVALEAAAANLDAVLKFLDCARSVFHRAWFVGLMLDEAPSAALLLREAGAIDVLTSILDVARLARLARRQFALAPADEPFSIRELVAERLPWNAHAQPT